MSSPAPCGPALKRIGKSKPNDASTAGGARSMICRFPVRSIAYEPSALEGLKSQSEALADGGQFKN